MSHRHSPEPNLSDRHDDGPARSPFAGVAGRFANWLAGVDHVGDEHDEPFLPGSDPYDEPATATRSFRAPTDPSPGFAGEREREPMGPGAATALAEEPEPEPEPETSSQFPLAPLGYNRAAVDDHLARLEREIAELRAVREPAMSITEELEWIGEQTSSILVVAHDKANETTRRAKEQAERTVAEAAAKALAITEQARRRLSEIDTETDQVWHERERLLDDVRIVSAALAELADEASGRFPAADGGMAVAAVGAPTIMFDAMEDDADDGLGPEPERERAATDPEATRQFSAFEEAEARGHGAVPMAGDGEDDPSQPGGPGLPGNPQ